MDYVGEKMKIRTKYNVHDFTLYVNETQGFRLVAKNHRVSADRTRIVPESLGLGSSYVASVAAMYVVTRKCGISSEHLEFHEGIPKVVTTMMRFHVSFMYQRFMDNKNLLAANLTAMDKAYIFTNMVGSSGGRTMLVRTGSTLENWKATLNYPERARLRYAEYTYEGSTRMIQYIKRTTLYEQAKDDYLKIIPDGNAVSGITPFGQKLLGKSSMVFLHCVIGAQANIGEPIVGKGIMSLNTQEEFRKLYDDYQNALDETNITKNTKLALDKVGNVLDTDVIRGFMRIPSDLLMYKKKALVLVKSKDSSGGEDSKDFLDSMGSWKPWLVVLGTGF